MFLIDDPILTRESAKDKIELTYGDLPPVIPDRPKGEWIDDGLYAEGRSEHTYHCSECTCSAVGFKQELSNFCPNCGADMRGGKE